MNQKMLEGHNSKNDPVSSIFDLKKYTLFPFAKITPLEDQATRRLSSGISESEESGSDFKPVFFQIQLPDFAMLRYGLPNKNGPIPG